MPAGLSIWFQYLVVFLTFLAVLSIIKFYDNRKRIFRLGRKLPGPKPWPIVGNALDFLDADLGKYMCCVIRIVKLSGTKLVYYYTRGVKKRKHFC